MSTEVKASALTLLRTDEGSRELTAPATIGDVAQVRSDIAAVMAAVLSQ